MAAEVVVREVQLKKNIGLALVTATLENFPNLSMRVFDSTEEFDGCGPNAVEITSTSAAHFFPPIEGKVQLDRKAQNVSRVKNSSEHSFAFESKYNGVRELNCISVYKRVIISLSSWAAELQVLGKVLEKCELASANEDSDSLSISGSTTTEATDSSSNTSNTVWNVEPAFLTILSKLSTQGNYRICAGLTEEEMRKGTPDGMKTTAVVMKYPGGALRYEAESCEGLFKCDMNECFPNQPFLRCKACKKWLTVNHYEAKRLNMRVDLNDGSIPLNRSILKMSPKALKLKVKSFKKTKDLLNIRISRMQEKLDKLKVQLSEARSREMTNKMEVRNTNFKVDLNELTCGNATGNRKMSVEAVSRKTRRKQYMCTRSFSDVNSHDSEAMAAPIGSPPRHAALTAVSWLLGKWKTTNAEVFYPTMTTVSYTEEIEFSHLGQPVLNYSSITRHAEKGNAMHLERGFLRVNPETGRLAFMVAHSFGLAEISEGEVNGHKITLESKDLPGMSFRAGAKATKVCRVLELVDENTLKSLVSMATSEQPMQEHLYAVYKRV